MGLLASLRNALKKRIYDKHNRIFISPEHTKNVRLKIDGKDNEISIDTKNLSSKSKIRINIYGDHNRVIIKDGFCLSGNMVITIGQDHPNFGKVFDSEFIIGENTSIEQMTYATFNCHSFCKIGSNCMIAYDVTIFNTDAHPIFDLKTKKILNCVKGIKIGNHVWIGARATILKNTEVADDNIIGWGSIVSGKFLEQHTALAGNPARIVKKSVTWDSNGKMNGYISNIYNNREID